jgi:hypothetical protein
MPWHWAKLAIAEQELSRQLHSFGYSNAEQGFAMPFASVGELAGKLLERCCDRCVEGEDARLQNGGDATLPSVVVGKMCMRVPILTDPILGPEIAVCRAKGMSPANERSAIAAAAIGGAGPDPL